MPSRDPLSVNYDGVVHTLVLRAIYAQRNRRGVQAFVSSPRGEFRNLDRGGRTKHERAFTRSCYYLVWRQYINDKTDPPWSLRLTWGEDADLAASARGRLARPVVLRVWPRDQARPPRERWSDGSGFRSEVGARIDD